MARIDTLEEAKVLAKALSAGQVKAEQRDVAIAALQDFKGKEDARDEFRSTRLNQTPLDAPPQFRQDMDREFADEEERRKFLQNAPSVRAARAASKGVDVNSGISPAIRAKAGLLNFNPEVATFVLDELIRSELPEGEVPEGIPAVTQIEGVNSALTRQDDGSYRYVAIDPLGTDLGDFAEFAGEAPQISAELLGGLGGATAGSFLPGPGTVIGGTAGAVAGGQLGLDARVQIAKMLGVPEDLIDDAVTNDIRLKEAAISAVGDLTASAVMGSARALSNSMGGKTLDAADVERMMPEVEKSLQQAAEFKDRTGQDLPLSMAQLTGDADMAVAEANLKRRARGKTATDLKVRETQAEQATNNALRDITEQRVRTPRDQQRSLEEVSEDVQTGVRGDVQRARAAQETAEEDLDASINALDEQVDPASFVRTREGAAESAEEARKAEKSAWDNYRKEVEWQPGVGSNVRMQSPADGPIKQVLLEMDDQSQRALLDSSRRSQQAFIKDAGLPEEGPTQGLAAEFIDPRELHVTLSDLKRRQRHAQKGIDPDGFRAEDLRKMINAIEETIDTAPLSRASSGRAVRPEKAARIRESFRSANDITARTHSLFDSSNMRQLLATKTRKGPGGETVRELEMPAGMIQNRMFQGSDARFLSDALDAVGHNPQTKAALADELVKKHRNLTKTDVNGDAHRRFMDEYRDHMELLGIDPARVRGAGSLAQAAKMARTQADQIAKRLSQTFGKRLGDETTDVTNIAKELRSLSPSKADNVMRYLDEADPRLANEVRDQSLEEVRRDLSSKGNTTLNFNKLWQTVDEDGKALEAIHGKQYVDDLKSMKNAQALVERGRLGRTAPGADATPAWLDVTRSLFGPLSKKQRFISAVQRTNKRLQGGALKSVISSPEDLRNFVKLKRSSPAQVSRALASDNLLGQLVTPGRSDDIEDNAARLNRLPQAQGDELRRAAGSTIVPGRPSPAEAVGGQSPTQTQSAGNETQQRPGIQQLHRHEGFRGQIYKDSVGVNTIGYGRNLESNPITPSEYREMGTTPEQVREQGINEEQAMVLFANDYARAVKTAVRTPGWAKLNGPQKDVVINMAFNLGPSRLRGFRKMMAALAAGDPALAADEMLDSKWAGQVGGRADELAEQMRTGMRPGGDL